MNILYLHNFHREGSSSGDDVVVKSEIELLQSYSHNVILFSRNNSEVDRANPIRKGLLLAQVPWSLESQIKLEDLLRKHRFDVAHVHTWFPLLSPSIYLVLKKYDLPIIQSLHDFRFFCPVAFFFRDGEICEECATMGLVSAIKHRCFQNSTIKSSLAVLTLQMARKAKVLGLIDKFIVFTRFGYDKFVQLGIAEEKLVIKPHFLSDPFPGWRYEPKEDYFIYVGRLSREKGIDFLLNVWEGITEKLIIVGSGELEDFVKKKAKKAQQIEFLGFQPREKVLTLLRKAKALIMPSIWYETFGMVIMEAYAAGTPVIATNLGAMSTLIEDGVTGFLFKRKDKQSLIAAIKKLKDGNFEELSRSARTYFEGNFTPESNYHKLMEIYGNVISK